MKHCELCKADFDETKPEEVTKHLHADKHGQKPAVQGQDKPAEPAKPASQPAAQQPQSPNQPQPGAAQPQGNQPAK
jgi:hypothetical protein